MIITFLTLIGLRERPTTVYEFILVQMTGLKITTLVQLTDSTSLRAGPCTPVYLTNVKGPDGRFTIYVRSVRSR